MTTMHLNSKYGFCRILSVMFGLENTGTETGGYNLMNQIVNEESSLLHHNAVLFVK